MRHLAFTCITFTLLICTAAFSQPRPTLSLDFDEGFNATGQMGEIVPTVEGKPQLVEGKFGKAMKSGPDWGYLHFPTKGILLPTRGAVEMWVCPLDWDGTEEKFHVFFDVRGEGALYLYKYYQGGLLMLSCPNIAGPYLSAPAPISHWKPGEWRHIAGTWSRSRQCVYVDGRLIGVTTPGLPSSLGETFCIGDHPWHIPRTSSSLIDCVRIYDRFLSEEHIAAHFRGDFTKVVHLSENTLNFTATPYPTNGTVSYLAEIAGADVDENALSAAFSLTPNGQAEKFGHPVAFANGAATEDVAISQLIPGNYRAIASILENGVERFRISRPLDIPTTEWKGNSIGLEDKVLPPWTPLRVESALGNRANRKPQPEVQRLPIHSPFSLLCWGRKYSFANNALPSQITSAGKALLARPLTLDVTVAGKPLRWTAGTARLNKASQTMAEVEGNAIAQCGGLTATLQTQIRAEYDGLLVIDISMRLPADQTPDSVVLQIPMRSDVVYYRHRWAPQWAGYTGNLASGNGVVDSDAFIPYAWLGDNDRGLFWFCETSQQWPNCGAKNAFETVRWGNEVVMRLNLLAPGQHLPKDWRYQFGLQATPVKPIPHDWRKWRLTPLPRATVHILWPTPTKDSMKYYGYPEAADPEVFGKRVDEFHARGVHVVPYSCLSFLSGASGEFQWFGSEWGQGGGDALSSDVAAYGAVFQTVCPKPKDYCDFIIWKNKQFMERYGLDGFYHDNTHPYACAAEKTGCGYRTADGKLQPTYPILAYRALYRRLYALVKGYNRPTFTMAHMSGKVTIPILAYEDSYLDGEHFRGVVKDSYMDVVSLDTFRAEFMGRQWGILPYFLPEFSPPYSEQVEPTRGLAGLLLIHDVAPWAIWCNLNVFQETFDALDAFGYADSEFIPYFDPTPPGTTNMEDVYISVYKLRDRALAIIANLSREDRSGIVSLNSKRIGLPLSRVLSWPDRTPAPVTDGAINIQVPRLGFRMVLIGKEPAK